MNYLKKGFALVFIVVLILSISTSALAETGIFNTPAVNLRTGPSTSNVSLGKVSQYATCDILGESGSWLHVLITSHTKNEKDLYGESGWVMAKFVDRSGGSGSGSGEESGGNKTYDDIPSIGSLRDGTIRLTSGYVYVRALPSQSSEKITQLENGVAVQYYDDKLTSVGSDSYTWYKLTAPYKGFVASNYIVAASSHPRNAEEAFGTSNLYEGCSSTYVKNVKCALNNYYCYLNEYDTNFDAKTRRSVMEFQSDHHAELEEYEFQEVADGIVGPKTRTLLWKYYGDKLMKEGYM